VSTDAASPRFIDRVRGRKWPVVVTLLVLSSGMAYSLLWAPLVRHHPSWIFSGDVFASYRSAHYIAWGSIGSVYSANTGLVTFPGILLLFAPLAALTGFLGLSESFPYFIPHPTAWLLLGPYEMIIGCSALFACDALAERLGVAKRWRIVLCLAEGVAIWPLLVFWGHPEDALAMALALYAVVFAFDGRWTGAGWLFGAAVATQPLTLLMLPILLALGGKETAAGLLLRSLLPSVLLLAVPLGYQFHPTLHALVDQPNYPRIDHATPWTSLAPRLGGSGKNIAVASGPGRVLAVLAACVLGWRARRWRDRPELLVWALALAMALRCFTESVMDSFYLWPAIALSLVVVMRASPRRRVLGVIVALSVTIVAEHHFAQWSVWWTAVTVGLVAVLSVAVPSRASRVRPQLPIPVNATDEGLSYEPSPVLAGATR
jgi:hypothetical protein